VSRFYTISESKPEVAIISDVLDYWNPQTDSIMILSSDLFYTVNDGRTWTKIWGDKDHGAFNMALDDVSENAWAFTETGDRTLQSYSPHNNTLWKYSLQQVDVRQNP